jgi:periplasmic copper chaperone A
VRAGWVMGLAAALSACAGPADMSVDEAWVRLPAVPGRPAAAYFTLHGGPAPATLVSVRADYAIRSEMHEMAGDARAMRMRPVATVPVPAGGEVEFGPGGLHVMLYDLDPRAKPGTSTLLTLTFADGFRLYRKAWIVAPGGDAPE